jgi:hypothetical protein
MTEHDDTVRDTELRELARDFVNELREMLRGANAEAVARGQQMMEAYVSDAPRDRSAAAVWSCLAADPAVFVQGDYGLLRTGLGRSQPDGAQVNTALVLERAAGKIVVTGPALLRSVGIVERFTFTRHSGGTRTVDRVVPRESLPSDDGSDDSYDDSSDDSYEGGYDRYEGRTSHDRTDRIRLPYPRLAGLLTVMSFDATSITGIGVLPIAPPVVATTE